MKQRYCFPPDGDYFSITACHEVCLFIFFGGGVAPLTCVYTPQRFLIHYGATRHTLRVFRVAFNRVERLRDECDTVCSSSSRESFFHQSLFLTLKMLIRWKFSSTCHYWVFVIKRHYVLGVYTLVCTS